MTSKKSKKKAVGNATRGFATQSVASKSKNADQLAADSSVERQSETLKPSPGAQNLEVDKESTAEGAAIDELSPEQLESHLEDADLQLLLEKHGDRVTKDSGREINRLRTEKRLLRPQADPLTLRSWLTEDMMPNVQSCLDEGFNRTKFMRRPTSDSGTSVMREDVLISRLWTLERVLIALDVPKDRVREALRYILNLDKGMMRDRSSIWGLEECLDWLAVSIDPAESFMYDLRPAITPGSGNVPSLEISNAVDNAGSISATEEFLTPEDSNRESSDEQNKDVEGGAKSSSDESDCTDDPESMVDHYLALQSKLHIVRPDLTEVAFGKNSRKAGKRHSISQKADRADPRVTKLLRKISRLKTDILFDHEEAHSRWMETRHQLTKELAERKRLRLDDATAAQEEQVDNRIAIRGEEHEKGSADAEDATESLADLFISQPEEISTGTFAAQQETSGSSSTVVLRDYGKPTGMKPRKLLEDACKARDSSAKVVSKHLNADLNHSCRSSLSVEWSRTQLMPLSSPTETIMSSSSSHSITVSMETVSTPSLDQADSYVATVALYLIFSHSPKESNVHLRLPSAWKDLWTELSTQKQNLDDQRAKDGLRDLRKLISQYTESRRDEDGALLLSGKTDVASVVSNDQSGKAQLQPVIATDEIVKMWSSKASTSSFQQMLASRRALPIWNFKSELLRSLDKNQVVIVCGQTGCGKSTQLPSFILEHQLSSGKSCKIYCAQPRRISAISLARRVSEELGEKRGDLGTSRSLIGYAIRLETRQCAETKLIYATTGVILRLLEHSGLEDVTHLILDEVHERTIDNDFLLIILRALMTRRPTLKVVLMSATVNASKFAGYFGGVPIVNVPGRTYPVETAYLEDTIQITNYHLDVDKFHKQAPFDNSDGGDQGPDTSAQIKAHELSSKTYSAKTLETLANFNEYHINFDLIVKLLETLSTKPSYVSYSKAILIFLPGLAEIRRLSDMLTKHSEFTSGWSVFPLHSTVAIEEQERVFEIPPKGHRKIILSTNIAETGITVPDITCVIDTGKHREMRFDERRQLSRLIDTFISRANATQRRGRAGRVQKGLCFHLFTKARHDTMMLEEQTPEMLRLSLQDLVLRVKICKLGNIGEILAQALDPPSPKAVHRAIGALIDVKALTDSEELTPLGRKLAQLPLDVFLGKLILLGSIYCCLDGAITIAAILSSKSPFSAPLGSRAQADQARLAFKRADSDLLTTYNAYSAWRHVCNRDRASEQQFCRRNFLSQQTLSNIEELKAQLTSCLVEAGYIEVTEVEKTVLYRVRASSRHRQFVELPERYTTNDENDLILNSVICWAFYPKLLKREGKGWRNVSSNQIISLHPTSVNKGTVLPSYWLSFYHIMQSSSKFYNAHETSAVEALAVALGCGEAEFKMFSGVIVIDGNRVRFRVDSWKEMVVLKFLRQNLKDIMAQAFRNPGRALSEEQQRWFDIWQQMFSRKVQ